MRLCGHSWSEDVLERTRVKLRKKITLSSPRARRRGWRRAGLGCRAAGLRTGPEDPAAPSAREAAVPATAWRRPGHPDLSLWAPSGPGRGAVCPWQRGCCACRHCRPPSSALRAPPGRRPRPARHRAWRPAACTASGWSCSAAPSACACTRARGRTRSSPRGCSPPG